MHYVDGCIMRLVILRLKKSVYGIVVTENDVIAFYFIFLINKLLS